MRHIYMAVDLGSTMIDSCLIDADGQRRTCTAEYEESPASVWQRRDKSNLNCETGYKLSCENARSDGRCDRGTAAGNA